MTTDLDARADADVLDAGDANEADVDADAGEDAGPAPTVEVSAPTAGEYTVGEALTIGFTATDAESLTLSLVESPDCPDGDEGVVLPTLGAVSASATEYVWLVPNTVAEGAYRIRAVASSGSERAIACSESFTLVQPPGCDDLGCSADNRACTTGAGAPACGGCLEAFVDVDGVCVPVECGDAPAPPANATLESVGGSQAGDVARYVCDAGFAASVPSADDGVVTRRCGADGRWADPSAECIPVACGTSPLAPSNARFEGVDRNTFGGTATYTCRPGFVVSGTTEETYQVTCGADGRWSEPAVCERRDCGALEAPALGSVATPDGTLFGETATYACESGYLLTAPARRTCDNTGAWSGVAPACAPVDCGAPPTVDQGSASDGTTTFQSTATYSCGAGYTLEGSDTVTCGADARWSAAPTCEDIDECSTSSVCTATGNVCTNTPGSWECSCGPFYEGASQEAGDATCTLIPAELGEPCLADAQCPENSWCSTVPGFERCAPRVFGGEAHQLDFAYVPAGTFEQGGVNSSITATPFASTLTRSWFVGRTEVTQGQWKAATGGVNPSCNQAADTLPCTTENRNDYAPAERIDWYSTLAYANWLSTEQGLQPCYELIPSTCADAIDEWGDGRASGCVDATFVGLSCTGYRLLTESEWERAARGGTTSRFFWGEEFEDTIVGQYAWFAGNSGDRTQPVGQKLPNPYGLYDVAGNVYEWCWDWFAEDYPEGAATDYLGPATGTERVLRGSTGGTPTFLMSSDQRGRIFPTFRNLELGFRLARTVP